MEFGGAAGTATVPLACQFNAPISQAHIGSPGVLSTAASSEQNQPEFRANAADAAGPPLVADKGERELQWCHAENILLRNDNATLRLEKSAGEVVMRKLRQTNSELRSQLEELNLQISQLSSTITSNPAPVRCPRLWVPGAQLPGAHQASPMCPNNTEPFVFSVAPPDGMGLLARDPDAGNEPAIAALRAAVAAAVPASPAAAAKSPPASCAALAADNVVSVVNIIAESVSISQVCAQPRNASAAAERIESWPVASDHQLVVVGNAEPGMGGQFPGEVIVTESPFDEAARLAQAGGVWQPVGPAEAAGGGCYLSDLPAATQPAGMSSQAPSAAPVASFDGSSACSGFREAYGPTDMRCAA